MTNNSIVDSFEQIEKSHFDNLAEDYEQNYRYNHPFTRYKMKKKVLSFIRHIPSIQKEPNRTWLEVGCGTGAYTSIVSKKTKSKIVATDISPRIIKVASKKNSMKNVSYKIASAYKLPYKDSHFDLVFGFYILHHLDQQLALNECLRVLRPGGILYFCEPNILNPVVFTIKNIPYIKKKVGDSPNETAVNPFFVRKKLSTLGTAEITYSEFIPMLPKFIKTSLSMKIDDGIETIFSKSPLRYLSGSLHIHFTKN